MEKITLGSSAMLPANPQRAGGVNPKERAESRNEDFCSRRDAETQSFYRYQNACSRGGVCLCEQNGSGWKEQVFF